MKANMLSLDPCEKMAGSYSGGLQFPAKNVDLSVSGTSLTNSISMEMLIRTA